MFLNNSRKRKIVDFEIMLLYPIYIYFKNPRILLSFPTFTLASLQPMKSPHYLWLHVFWKFVNVRLLLNSKSVYPHKYFEWKHKPKHLSEFWWENIHLNLSGLFHIWFSCKFQWLTHAWKKYIKLFHLYMHDNLISRRLICFQLCSFLWSSVHVK